MRPQLPAIGLGTAAIALVPEMDARATLDHALDRGIRYFDTAPLYGGGQAEIRLGQMLRSAPRDVVVSTKCGCRREFGAAPAYRTGQPDKWDFSEAAIRESVERSCERLHRDCLDIVFLHDIHQAQDQALGEALPVLRELQSRGRIAMVGVGCNSVAEHLAAVNADAADALLVAGRWTLADRTAGHQLISLAAEKGCKLIVGGVLNSGCPVDPRAAHACFDYRPITADERQVLCELDEIAQRHGTTLIAAALQFPGRDARISTTLLGATSPAQLAANLDGLAADISDHFWQAVQLKALYA
ncbi:aldo/keto reductase [Sinorhizobium medicae]|nr:aldo/keto reductase [Sinorhizobium medicae]MDX0878458.1 aldo/keto reductase [Sinorhizobium medicae]